jgi:hypothetical protein
LALSNGNIQPISEGHFKIPKDAQLNIFEVGDRMFTLGQYGLTTLPVFLLPFPKRLDVTVLRGCDATLQGGMSGLGFCSDH